MTSTATYNFDPAASNLMLTAFGRIGIRRTEITAQHLTDCENEANLLQVEFSNRNPNLWTRQLQSVSLTEGTATYTMPRNIYALVAVYMTTTSGGVSTDRILYPYSSFEYSAIPDKTEQGPPTAFWMNRLITPTITLWPVPDGNATYTLNLNCLSQIEDVSLANGTTLNVPYRWLDAWTSALTARLADIYPDALVKSQGPGAVAGMWAKAERAWNIAATEDKERVPQYLSVSTIGYYR